MHPHWKYLFLAVLAHVSPATSGPTSPPKATPKPTGCHSSSILNHGFIFFRAEDDKGFDFGIITKYTQYYSATLKDALRADSFTVDGYGGDGGYLHRANECDWQKVKTVKGDPFIEAGGPRGSIYWKYSDLQTVRDSKGENPQWAQTSPSHIPHNKAALPSNHTLDRIERVLKWNLPAADVYSAWSIGLSWTCLVFSFIISMLVLHMRIERNKRQALIQALRQTLASQDVELAPIAVDSTAKLTSTDETPACVPIPTIAILGRDRVMMPGSDAISTQERGRRAQSDPPPRYSNGSAGHQDPQV